MIATTKWIEGLRSEVDDSRNHSVILDIPEEKGGTDVGTSALELCMMSYSGCVNTIFNMIAKKMRIEFAELEVVAEGSKGDGAKTITNTKVTVKIKSDASDEKLQKCLGMTADTCPVGVLFHQAGVETEYLLERL
ncbi:MAG: OsmC family protein [Marinifilaceae bacterium]|jgi:putative redox protein|nr:OsmC family protein [Marinifilaceae bacterium]